MTHKDDKISRHVTFWAQPHAETDDRKGDLQTESSKMGTMAYAVANLTSHSQSRGVWTRCLASESEWVKIVSVVINGTAITSSWAQKLIGFKGNTQKNCNINV